MDSHAVDSAAGRAPAQPTMEEPDELSRLRERLAFYESFDRLIQDNIGRAGELLRQAMELRETASLEVAAARVEAERDRTADRVRYRSLFAATLDEVTALQGQAERLARRLADALDDVEAALPPGATAGESAAVATSEPESPATRAEPAEAPRLQPTEDGDEEDIGERAEPMAEAIEAVAPAPDEAEPATEPVPAEAESGGTGSARFWAARPPSPAPAGSPAAVEGETGDEPANVRPFALEDVESVRRQPVAEAAPTAPAKSVAESGPTIPAAAERPGVAAGGVGAASSATIVLVHGVPRATTALSLKRYLEGLAHVEAVEPREFAEGVLRLEVSGERPLAFDDLRSWPEGAGLEAVHVRSDLVEVRLPR
jgi:hypothetical protein